VFVYVVYAVVVVVVADWILAMSSPTAAAAELIC